jgi:hypothetical protein
MTSKRQTGLGQVTSAIVCKELTKVEQKVNKSQTFPLDGEIAVQV